MDNDGNEESIADIIFRRSRQEQLVAEGLFGPTLAYLVSLTSPTGIQGAILSWAMAFLVVIPVFRYLVFTDRIAPFDQFLDLTVRPVELCAILGVVQLFKYSGTQFLGLSLNVLQTTALITTGATLFYIIIFELVFRKYRFCWGTLFYVKLLTLKKTIDIPLDDFEVVFRSIMENPSNRGRLRAAFGLLKLTLIMVTFGQTAYYLLKDSIPEREEDESIEELRGFVEENQENRAFNERQGVWFAFGVSAVVVLPALAGISWVLSLVVATFGTLILTLLIMRLTKHIVALSYIAFGTMEFEQFVTTNRRWLVLTTTYTSSVYLLHFYPL